MKYNGWSARVTGAVAAVALVVLLATAVPRLVRDVSASPPLAIPLLLVAVGVVLMVLWMVAHSTERRDRISSKHPDAYTLAFTLSDEMKAVLPWRPVRLSSTAGTLAVSDGSLFVYIGGSEGPSVVFDAAAVEVGVGWARSGLYLYPAVIVTASSRGTARRLALLPQKTHRWHRNSNEAETEELAAELRQALLAAAPVE